MTAVLQAVQQLVVVAALVAAVLPASLACCAGVRSIHGRDCCAMSASDPTARACCQGGDELDTSDPGTYPVVDRAKRAPVVDLRTSEATTVLARHRFREWPGREPTYNLHSALLL